MTLGNPIIASSGSLAKAPIGLYSGVLESVQAITKKKFESEELEPRAEFKFKLTGADGKTYTMWRDFFPTNNPKHALHLFVVGMTGQAVDTAVLSNPDAWWAYVQSLAGKTYQVQVAPTQTGKTKIGAAFPSIAQSAPSLTQGLQTQSIPVDESLVNYGEADI